MDRQKWDTPPLFTYLGDKGGVDDEEMHRVFNMGIGLIMIIPASDEEKLPTEGLRWEPFPVGTVIKGERKVILK